MNEMSQPIAKLAPQYHPPLVRPGTTIESGRFGAAVQGAFPALRSGCRALLSVVVATLLVALSSLPDPNPEAPRGPVSAVSIHSIHAAGAGGAGRQALSAMHADADLPPGNLRTAAPALPAVERRLADAGFAVPASAWPPSRTAPPPDRPPRAA
jgi:hypothetical protein